MAHLLRKALNAMPKGGALEVWARCVEGDAVKVWVGKDSGNGIPAELRELILDPFFSTKGSSGQVGLGRSLYRAIAEAHRGSVSVESTVGASSTCTGESSRAELLAASAPPAPAARDLRLRALSLSILSAAVICEDPSLFGFDVDCPSRSPRPNRRPSGDEIGPAAPEQNEFATHHCSYCW